MFFLSVFPQKLESAYANFPGNSGSCISVGVNPWKELFVYIPTSVTEADTDGVSNLLLLVPTVLHSAANDYTIHCIAHLQSSHCLFLQQTKLCAKNHEWCTQSFSSSIMAYGALPCHLKCSYRLQQPSGYVKMMLAIMIGYLQR
jgi:hypothetical protein